MLFGRTPGEQSPANDPALRLLHAALTRKTDSGTGLSAHGARQAALGNEPPLPRVPAVPAYVPAKDVAAYLGISAKTLRRWSAAHFSRHASSAPCLDPFEVRKVGYGFRYVRGPGDLPPAPALT